MDELQWHLDRQKGIGGSDASTVLGINPWKSRLQLYHEKVDEIKADKIDNDNIRFKLGHVLEPMIAEEYAKRTGYILETRPSKTHSKYPFMIGNIDRHVTVPYDYNDINTPSNSLLPSETLDRGILEIKTKGAFINWEGDEIPEYYNTQGQHYMAVYDYNWVDFAVLDFLKFEIKITRINRDNDLIAKIINEEAKFWDLVQNKTPPKIEPTKSCSDFLKECYKDASPITINISDNEEATFNSKTLFSVKVSRKNLDEIELTTKNYFMDLMKNAEKAIGDGYTITWKNDKDSTKFDTDKFKFENPQIYKKYLEPKKGSRRFLSKFDKE